MAERGRRRAAQHLLAHHRAAAGAGPPAAGQATGSEAEARENLSMISDAEMQARLETVRAYPVAWLKKGPAYVPPEIRPDEQAAIVWEHGRRNMELRAAGRMAIVGPLQGAGEIVGMCIFCVPEAEAREIMEGDGAVRPRYSPTRSSPSMASPARRCRPDGSGQAVMPQYPCCAIRAVAHRIVLRRRGP